MTELIVEDPATKERRSCTHLPRFGWRCGLCGRGWLHTWVGAKCDKCGAVVVAESKEER